MLKHKIIDAHPDKSGYLLFGSETFTDYMKQEIKHEPVYFNKFNLKLKAEEKYRGQIIKSNLSSSGLATTGQDRKDKRGSHRDETNYGGFGNASIRRPSSSLGAVGASLDPFPPFRVGHLVKGYTGNSKDL